MLIPNLPGKKAHLKMAPEPRVITLKTEIEPPPEALDSAVLVLLLPPFAGSSSSKHVSSGELFDWEVVVIKRSIYEGIHSGQIALPGGKREDSDIDYADTACRESYEELSIDRTKIEIIGLLSRIYVPPSNYIIYPVLAYAKSDVELTPDNKEVVEYRRIALRMFNPDTSKICRVQIGGEEFVNAPGYVIDDYFIWGATAMILSELYQLIEEAKLSISLISP